MSLNITGSYRVKKQQPGAAASRKNPLNQLHKKPSRSSSASPRKQLSSHGSTAPLVLSHHATNSLVSFGWPTDNLSRSESLPESVEEAITFILNNQFTPFPETLTGIGLSRESTAEILNFRKYLPRVVPIIHLHSILPSRTETERSISGLIADGTIRRVQIRTSNNSYLDGVIRTEDFITSVAQSKNLDSETKDAFLELLESQPSLKMISSDENNNMRDHNDNGDETAITTPSFPKEIIMDLLSAGFLTINLEEPVAEASNRNAASSSASSGVDITTLTPTTARTYVAPMPQKDNSHLSTLASISSLRKAKQADTNRSAVLYTITPPNLGLYTNLYAGSRGYMLEILRKCPHREATMSFLREKWDGGVSKGKKVQGKFEGRTRKWRELKGVTVDWVIGGLMGGGILEGFEAIGLGMGVKLVKGN